MRYKRIFVFLLIVVLLGILAIYYPYLTGKSISTGNINYEPEPAIVTRIVDGDTIHVTLNGKDETIRLLGINTPEKSTSYYKTSLNFLKEIENKTIFILRDKEDTDQYKRKLRYVFYENRFLNVEILQNGLATSFMTSGLKYEEKLNNAEKFAITNNLELWERSSEKCADCIKLVELNYTNEYFIIKNNCEFYCNLTGWIVKDDANHVFKLENLNASEEKRYVSNKSIWNDEGDRFFMRDKNGFLVIYYKY
jgi:micrococcal nuclease